VKATVSVPDDVYESAERLARRQRRSRSEIYSAALREYVARHSPAEITEALNQVVAEVGDDQGWRDGMTVPEAARRTGKNPETIRRWIRGGRLSAHKVGTQHIIDEGRPAPGDRSRRGAHFADRLAPDDDG
jgi:excisionase family DNA binding protein